METNEGAGGESEFSHGVNVREVIPKMEDNKLFQKSDSESNDIDCYAVSVKADCVPLHVLDFQEKYF